MANTTITVLDVCNMAQLQLGDELLVSIEAPTKKAERWYALNYPLIRDATLEAHPWNFATYRHTLNAYTEPDATITPAAATGTNILVTASDDIFTADDVGRHIVPDAGGRADIVTFVAADQVAVDFETDFDGTDAIEAEDWKLYYAFPEYDFSYRIPPPADWLRIWRAQDSQEHDVQGGYILSDEETINVRVVRQVTNPQEWSQMFTQALVYHLAAKRAEVTTGMLEKADYCFKKYEHLLRKAKTRDGQEGTPESLRANTLLRARLGERTWRV